MNKEQATAVFESRDAIHRVLCNPTVQDHLEEINKQVDWDAVKKVELEAATVLLKYYADFIISLESGK